MYTRLLLFVGLLEHPVPCVGIDGEVGEAAGGSGGALPPQVEELARHPAQVVAEQTRIALEAGPEDEELAGLIGRLDLLNRFPGDRRMRERTLGSLV